MKRIWCLLKNCRSVCGFGFILLSGGYILLQGLELLVNAMIPGLLLDSLLQQRSIIILLVLSLFFVFVTWCSHMIKREKDLLLFKFRLHEISHIQKICIQQDVSMMETADGKERVEKALEAVCSGNDYGIEAYLYALLELISCIITFCGYFIFLCFLPGWFVSLCVICILFTIPLEIAVRKRDNLFTQQRYDETRHMQSFRRVMLHDDYAKDVRMFQANPFFHSKLTERTEQVIQSIKQREEGRNKRTIWVSVIFLFRNIVLILCISSFFIRISAGEVVIYIGIMSGIDALIQKIWDNIGELINNKEPVRYYCMFVEKEISGIKREEEIQCKTEKEDIIIFKNISFSYHNNEIFNNLSFEIHKGEKIAVVGENGVGKTTLIKLLLGILKAQEGIILINGIPMNENNRAMIWSNISIALQEAPVFPFSLMENVTGSLKTDVDMERYQKVLRQTGLEHLARRSRIEYEENTKIAYSGGEKQRIFMGRLLYKEAQIYLLDEPTASMDAKSETMVYHSYQQILKDKTCIFVTHRLGSTSFCDKILFLERGNQAILGTLQEVYEKSEKFREMYRAQKSFYEEGANVPKEKGDF